MAKMSIALAQKIIKDSRYGVGKKKLARRVVREAKKAGKIKKPPKRKTTIKTKTIKTKAQSKTKAKPKSTRPKTRIKVKPKPKAKTKTRPKKGKAKTKTRIKRAKSGTKGRTKNSKKTARSTSSRKNPPSKTRTKRIKFYDAAKKKYVLIPRSECRVKRNKNPRGGDQLTARYKGRKLFTSVKKGFKL